jgi:hypothetical protein
VIGVVGTVGGASEICGFQAVNGALKAHLRQLRARELYSYISAFRSEYYGYVFAETAASAAPEAASSSSGCRASKRARIVSAAPVREAPVYKPPKPSRESMIQCVITTTESALSSVTFRENLVKTFQRVGLVKEAGHYNRFTGLLPAVKGRVASGLYSAVSKSVQDEFNLASGPMADLLEDFTVTREDE